MLPPKKTNQKSNSQPDKGLTVVRAIGHTEGGEHEIARYSDLKTQIDHLYIKDLGNAGGISVIDASDDGSRAPHHNEIHQEKRGAEGYVSFDGGHDNKVFQTPYADHVTIMHGEKNEVQQGAGPDNATAGARAKNNTFDGQAGQDTATVQFAGSVKDIVFSKAKDGSLVIENTKTGNKNTFKSYENIELQDTNRVTRTSKVEDITAALESSGVSKVQATSVPGVIGGQYQNGKPPTRIR